MKLLNQLLKRRKDVPTHVRQGTQDPRIATVIDDALASAGLTPDTPQNAKILSVIEDALTRAGLRRSSESRTAEPLGTSRSPDLKGITHEAREAETQQGGTFLARTFGSSIGSLCYKVYVPAGYASNVAISLPLVVMLHGCTQSPDDFAAGTRMNALADLHGFMVAYPAQSTNANGSKCWNWFRPQDQVRGKGEPALIAGMTAQLVGEYRIDLSRIYVAGLSAGGAMAVVLGQTYPEVFAAIGVHSGLPYRAARDVSSAFAAMKGNAGTIDSRVDAAVPTIVFHGDRDHTVAVSNGDAIIFQAGKAGATYAQSGQVKGEAPSGRSFTRTDYTDASGHVVFENWRIHGGGHAWMGGSAMGTYTDPMGPDASVEMLRFFFSQTRS